MISVGERSLGRTILGLLGVWGCCMCIGFWGVYGVGGHWHYLVLWVLVMLRLLGAFAGCVGWCVDGPGVWPGVCWCVAGCVQWVRLVGMVRPTRTILTCTLPYCIYWLRSHRVMGCVCTNYIHDGSQAKDGCIKQWILGYCFHWWCL